MGNASSLRMVQSAERYFQEIGIETARVIKIENPSDHPWDVVYRPSKNQILISWQPRNGEIPKAFWLDAFEANAVSGHGDRQSVVGTARQAVRIRIIPDELKIGAVSSTRVLDDKDLSIEIPGGLEDELSNLGFTRVEMLEALRDMHLKETPLVVSFSLKPEDGIRVVTSQLGVLENDFRDKIAQKRKSGKKEFVIYEIGIGGRGVEFKEFLNGLIETLKHEVGEEIKDWRIIFNAIDISSIIVDINRDNFEELVQRFRQEGINIEFHLVVASALKYSDMDKVRREHGNNEKADYIIHRNVTYPNEFTRNNTLSRSNLSKQNLPRILNIYLQMRNILGALGQNGTRYITDDFSWSTMEDLSYKKHFILPGGHVLADERDIQALQRDNVFVPTDSRERELHEQLRKVATGVYIIDDINRVSQESLIGFLTSQDEQDEAMLIDIARNSAQISAERIHTIHKRTDARTGGIDLTSDKALTVQNNGQGIKFHIDPAQLKELENAPGFVPVIINIQPMSNLRLWLGINSAANDNIPQAVNDNQPVAILKAG